jgi:hypothetical protein
MIMSTTEELQGFDITDYLGLVCGEVVSGANIVRDVMATVTDYVGGRSAAYEDEMKTARDATLQGLSDRGAADGRRWGGGDTGGFRGDRRTGLDADVLGGGDGGAVAEAMDARMRAG